MVVFCWSIHYNTPMSIETGDSASYLDKVKNLPPWTPNIGFSYTALLEAKREMLLPEVDPERRKTKEAEVKRRVVNLVRTVEESTGKKLPAYIDCTPSKDMVDEIDREMPGLRVEGFSGPMFYETSEGRMVTVPIARTGLRRRERPDLKKAKDLEDSQWVYDSLCFNNLTQGLFRELPAEVRTYLYLVEADHNRLSILRLVPKTN